MNNYNTTLKQLYNNTNMYKCISTNTYTTLKQKHLNTTYTYINYIEQKLYKEQTI